MGLKEKNGLNTSLLVSLLSDLGCDVPSQLTFLSVYCLPCHNGLEVTQP